MKKKLSYSVADRHLIVDAWVGQTLRKYRKLRQMTQQDLGQAIAQVLLTRSGQSEPGLSKSAISRIEKGLFIPPQNKLQIMIDVLKIVNPAEQQRLFERCGYSWEPPLGKSSWPEQPLQHVRQMLQAQPLDLLSWIELISLLSQERQYIQAQHVADEALIALQKHPESTLREGAAMLLQAKQALAKGMALEYSAEALPWLRCSLQDAAQAESHFRQFPPSQDSQRYFVEVLRAQISAGFRLWVVQERLRQMDLASLALRYQVLAKQLQQLTRLLEKTPWSSELEPKRLQGLLYAEREQISLDYKWLEFQEQYSLPLYLQQQCPEVGELSSGAQLPINLWGHFKGNLSALARFLKPLYLRDDEGLIFMPAQHLQLDWNAFYPRLHRFLDHQTALANYAVTPDQIPRAVQLNTCLLYVLVLARLGRFNESEGELLLKSLFLLCQPQTLFTWHYIAACFYAYRWLFHHNPCDMEQLVQHWMRWSRAQLDNPEHYEITRFEHILQEPCLWVACLSQAEDSQTDSAALKWMKEGLHKLLQDSWNRQKDKGN